MNSVSIRGCSWCNFASRLRAFDRDSYSSDYWGFNQGFRVACTDEPVHSLRGSSWSRDKYYMRSSMRSEDLCGFGHKSDSFRVACETEPEDNRGMCIRSSSWSSSKDPLLTATRLSSEYIAHYFSRFQFGFRVARDYEYSWVHGRCVRSGSWQSDTSALCAATRGAYEPDNNSPFGFRLACEEVE